MADILSFLAGFFTAVFAEPLRRSLFKSTVTLKFEPRIDFGKRWIAFTTTSMPEVEAKYIRVSAKCSSRIGVTANRCRPFLTRIEYQESDTNGYKELHRDPIPLNWAYIGDQELDIHPQMEFFFDVVAVNSNEKQLRPQTTEKPLIWAKLLEGAGRYKFTVVLSGENIKPVALTLEFEWKREFESLKEDCF